MFNEGPKKEFGGLGELVIVDIHILHSFPLGIKSINRLKKHFQPRLRGTREPGEDARIY